MKNINSYFDILLLQLLKLYQVLDGKYKQLFRYYNIYSILGPASPIHFIIDRKVRSRTVLFFLLATTRYNNNNNKVTLLY